MCLDCLRFLKLNDTEATVRVLKEAVLSFVQECGCERFHNSKDLAESICIEASKLLDLFQWCTAKDVRLLSARFANILQIDMADSLRKTKNARRYPKLKYVGMAHTDCLPQRKSLRLSLGY